MASSSIPEPPGTAPGLAALQAEIAALRQALWECYALAGGDPGHYRLDELGSDELVPLVVDCVRDLRGFFDAARRDLR
jgi:hypothetical protein